MRAKEWGKHNLLTEHRQALAPILVYCEGELDLLPDMPAEEKRRWQATTTDRPGTPGTARIRAFESSCAWASASGDRESSACEDVNQEGGKTPR